MKRKAARLAFVAAALLPLAVPVAVGQTIVDEWASVAVAAPPELRDATVEPQTTALLMLDFMGQNCGRRPRCLASLPRMQRLLAEARARGVLVVHSIIANTTTADILPDVAAASGEPWVRSGPNKFLGTTLEAILRERRVRTVIVVGTAAHGAVLNTAAHAALLGMSVVVPVDGISAEAAYPEQYTAWHLANAPGVGARTTLTTSDRISFR